MVFDLKTTFLKMNNITVIELIAIAKQLVLKVIINSEKLSSHKFEALLEINEQVLRPGLEISRNTTRSVNTSATLDQPISGR